MTYWNDLLATALVGTARAPLPELTTSSELSAILAALEGQSPEQQLLTAAGSVLLWQHAGAQPNADTRPMPVQVLAQDDNPCPPRLAAPLERMLHGNFDEVLPEYLAALKIRGYTLAHRWLPELLELACKDTQLTGSIVELLGSRGQWLAQQNPLWTGLVTMPDPANWDAAETDTRIQIVRHLRATNPSQAITLLSPAWKKYPADTRLAFIELFDEGLSHTDIDFLEATLDDRSKRVQRYAAQLLARLPQSAYMQRMILRVRPLLRLQRTRLGKLKLTVTLPSDYDKAMKRDAIVDWPPRRMGKHTWHLRQMLGIVPPSYWSDGWNLSPADLIKLADGTQEHKILLEAWAESAARQGDAAWANALLQRWNNKHDFAIMDYLPDLIALLPSQQLEPWLESRARWVYSKLRAVQDVQDDFGMLDFLKAYAGQSGKQSWGTKLSSTVLDLARMLAEKKMGGSSPLNRWASDFGDFALVMNPSVAAQAELGWPKTSYYWRKSIERLQTTLQFRREMYARLNEKNRPG